METIPELPENMQNIISELSSLSGPEAEEDSMETQAGVGDHPPHFPQNSKPSNHTEEIGVLVLMMGQLLECVSMAPMVAVHICATKCAQRLEQVTYLIYTKGRKVTTEEVVTVLVLHQSIKGLISACPHTFIVAQLEDYITETQEIIDSLYSRFKDQITDNNSSKKSVVTAVKWMA